MIIKVQKELIDQIAIGNCVLILGAGISAGNRGLYGIPLADELACELAQLCDYPEKERLLTKVAQYYEMIKGRNELIKYIVSRMSSPPLQPLETHKLIASLPIKIIVTTNMDTLLELEFERLGIPINRVLKDEQLAYADPNKVMYVKMHGSIDVPESIVITEDDYLEYLRNLGALSIYLKALFATKTFLFLGYRLADPDFKQAYTGIVCNLDRHLRRGYAVQKNPSLYDVKWWGRESRNIEIIDADAIEFLTALKERLRKASPLIKVTMPKLPLPPRPYKFLDYFEEADRPIFFGRDFEAEAVKNLILAHKLTVLYGPSGTGKTSLIKAKLIPELHAEGYHTLYIRALQDPIILIREQIYKFEASYSVCEESPDTPLHVVLQRRLKPSSRWVIFLDQFEEFFIRLGPALRGYFAEVLWECLKLDQVDLRFVVSIRDDYFVRLDELSLKDGSNDIYINRFYLRDLDAEQARLCISKPAELFGLHFETALLNQLIEDLKDKDFEPPYLQIVCHKLFENLRPREIVFTQELYQKLGGVQDILARYLDDVINEFKTERDREAAKGILKCLVTHEETKDAMKFQQITCDVFVRRLGQDEAHLASILEELRDRRLIRKIAEQDLYELAHEVIVEKVWEWVTDEEVLFKSMRAVVRQGLGDWQRLGVVLQKEKWTLVNEHRRELLLSTEEIDLMLHSAIKFGEDISYWFCRAEKVGVPVWKKSYDILKYGSPRERHNLMTVLEERSEKETLPLLEQALLGPYPALARNARRILEHMNDVKAQQIIQVNSPLADFVFIPACKCIIGQDKSPIEDRWEEPAHEVFVSDFWIGRYPITNIEYANFVKDTNHRPPENWIGNTYPPGKADYPVVYISWYDALAFCKRLTEKKGRPYRLPTEAEWEKAASWDPVSRTRRIYAYGDQFDVTKCNTRELGLGEPTPIGQHSSTGGDSAFGVSDMTGNVWEWTSTRSADDKGHIFAYPYDPLDGREDLESGATRVLHGGSCYNTRVNARCSHRFRINPHYRNGDIGFRVASCYDPQINREYII